MATQPIHAAWTWTRANGWLPALGWAALGACLIAVDWSPSRFNPLWAWGAMCLTLGVVRWGVWRYCCLPLAYGALAWVMLGAYKLIVIVYLGFGFRPDWPIALVAVVTAFHAFFQLKRFVERGDYAHCFAAFVTVVCGLLVVSLNLGDLYLITWVSVEVFQITIWFALITILFVYGLPRGRGKDGA